MLICAACLAACSFDSPGTGSGVRAPDGKADGWGDGGFVDGAIDSDAILGDTPIITYAVGDLCDNKKVSPGCQDTSDQVIAAGDAQFVFVLGDNAYDRGTLEQYETNYEPTWGRLKNITIPAPGNHEGFNNFAGYFAYFGKDGTRTKAPGKVGEGFYSFDFNEHWHVAVLNTDLWDTKQSRWLKADLAKTKAECILVTGHHPRFSPGQYGPYGDYGTPEQSPKIWKVLTDAKVDLYLSGHDHLYARYAKQDKDGNADPHGTRAVIVGTGGRALYPIHTGNIPNLEASYAGTKDMAAANGPFGVAQVKLGDHGYGIHYANTTGTYADDVVTLCNRGPQVGPTP